MAEPGPAAAECVFCAILAGRLPSSRVYRDEICTAFLDIQQNEQDVQHVAIKENQVVVGRVDPKRGITPDIDLTQFDTLSTVSRQHARICVDNSYFSIEDLGS